MSLERLRMFMLISLRSDLPVCICTDSCKLSWVFSRDAVDLLKLTEVLEAVLFIWVFSTVFT